MSHPVLDRPAYDNIQMQSPEGQLMAYVSAKKARFYLKNGLAHRVDDNSFRLNFVPAGLGQKTEVERTPRENICVCCGSTGPLTIHHIVPSNFRKTDFMNADRSHDVVSLCVPCHTRYEVDAYELKKRLFAEAGLAEDSSIFRDHKNRLIGCAQRVLAKYGDKIPPARRAELEAVANSGVYVKEYKRKKHSNRQGYLLVKDFTPEQADAFILMWRKHFIDTMNPEHMPKGWSLYYRNEDHRAKVGM